MWKKRDQGLDARSWCTNHNDCLRHLKNLATGLPVAKTLIKYNNNESEEMEE